jgi:hypothetical protein
MINTCVPIEDVAGTVGELIASAIQVQGAGVPEHLERLTGR